MENLLCAKENLLCAKENPLCTKEALCSAKPPREEEVKQEYLLCQGSKISTPNYPTFNNPTFPSSLQAVQQPFE